MGEQLVKNAGNYEAIYYAINESYGGLAAVNAVAKYNHERWFKNLPVESVVL
jgi:hypothetical protein